MKELDLPVQNISLPSYDPGPIHISGQLQPHGVVLVLQEPKLKILQVSSNTSSVFGIAPSQMLDKQLEEIIDPFQLERIKAGLLEESLDFINPTKIWVRRKGDDYLVFDAVFHRSEDLPMIYKNR